MALWSSPASILPLLSSDTHQAAHRMSELRESIRSILDEIPSILANAKQYLDVFVESPRLHKCNADLYVAILDTLNAIVRQYQKHVTRKFWTLALLAPRLMILASRPNKLCGVQAKHEWDRTSGENEDH